MIDFTRAFDSAWERMLVILFRPFDFGKWCVIGFGAFLAGFLQGGNGFNGGSFNMPGDFNRSVSHRLSAPGVPQVDVDQIKANLVHAFSGMETGLMILFGLILLVVIFGISLLVIWLGTRGQFLLLDNIVRNRGAVAGPWQVYARQGNSLFLFYVLLMVFSFAVFIPILIVAVILCLPLIQHHRWPEGGEIGGLVAVGTLYFVLAMALNFILFIFREFGVPLMFRNGLMAWPAFLESLGLIAKHPGSIIVFVLLRFALYLGVVVVSIMACCACCIGLFPYVGTVAILPALIYVRCFTLDCLAQFGPEYDVWTVDVPPSGPPPIFNLPPRLG